MANLIFSLGQCSPINHRKDGYTLIEMLLAIILLSFLLLTVGRWQFDMIYQLQRQYWQTIAIQQLQNMLVELQSGGVNSMIINNWNQNNRFLLPKGFGQLNSTQLQLNWQVNHGIWYCSTPADQQHACLSIKR